MLKLSTHLLIMLALDDKFPVITGISLDAYVYWKREKWNMQRS